MGLLPGSNRGVYGAFKNVERIFAQVPFVLAVEQCVHRGCVRGGRIGRCGAGTEACEERGKSQGQLEKGTNTLHAGHPM